MIELTSPIHDPKVDEVLRRLEANRSRPAGGGPRASGNDPQLYADYGFSIQREQGELIYLLCRAIGARRAVEFATSVGVSARQNLADAGLSAFADIREGDARPKTASARCPYCSKAAPSSPFASNDLAAPGAASTPDSI